MGKMEKLEDADSEDSIQELVVPPKPPPVVVEIEEENNLILNVIGVDKTDVVINSKPNKTELARVPLTPIQTKALGSDNSPYHWSPEMVQFYNEESNESFDMNGIQQTMDNFKRLWDVHTPKRAFEAFKRRKSCFNCGKFGHDEKRCRPYCCSMCGSDKHRVKRCPKSMCLSCAKGSREFIASCYQCNKKAFKSRCGRCKLYGHAIIDCPDHWRRFHHVTTLGAVQPPSGPIYKPSSEFWCCNCAKKGHLDVDCPTYTPHNPFPRVSPIVYSYRKEFARDSADTTGSKGEVPALSDVTYSTSSVPRASKRKTQDCDQSSPAPNPKKKRYFEAIADLRQSEAIQDTFIFNVTTQPNNESMKSPSLKPNLHSDNLIEPPNAPTKLDQAPKPNLNETNFIPLSQTPDPNFNSTKLNQSPKPNFNQGGANFIPLSGTPKLSFNNERSGGANFIPLRETPKPNFNSVKLNQSPITNFNQGGSEDVTFIPLSHTPSKHRNPCVGVGDRNFSFGADYIQIEKPKKTNQTKVSPKKIRRSPEIQKVVQRTDPFLGMPTNNVGIYVVHEKINHMQLPTPQLSRSERRRRNIRERESKNPLPRKKNKKKKGDKTMAEVIDKKRKDVNAAVTAAQDKQDVNQNGNESIIKTNKNRGRQRNQRRRRLVRQLYNARQSIEGREDVIPSCRCNRGASELEKYIRLKN